jgi:hypothetical protein
VPAFVFTVPETLASLAFEFELEPTCTADAKPTSAHVVAFPATNVARESEGESACADVTGPTMPIASAASAMSARRGADDPCPARLP